MKRNTVHTERRLESRSACWLLFLLCFIVYAIVYMTKNMFTAAMASIVEAGIMTKAQTGAISGVFWLVYAPFQVVGGFAADRFSPSRLICIGLGGAALANLVIYLNQSYWVIMTVWILSAILQFGLWPAVFKIISTQLMPSVRSAAIFWMMFSTSAGISLSMFIASLVQDWRRNFLISFLMLTASLLVWLVVYSWMERRMVTCEVETTPQPSEALDSMPRSDLPTGRLFFSSGLLIIAVIAFLRCMVDNSIKMLTPTMLMESYAELPASLATRMSVILIAFSAGGLALGRVVQKRLGSNEIKMSLILQAIAFPALLLATMIGRMHYLLILGLLAVATVFLHGASPLTNSFIAARYTDYGKNGTVSGILNATSSVGNIVASYLFAALSEWMAWDRIVLIWAGSILLALILCLSVLPAWSGFIGARGAARKGRK